MCTSTPYLEFFLHRSLRHSQGPRLNNSVLVFDVQIIFLHQLVQPDVLQENVKCLVTAFHTRSDIPNLNPAGLEPPPHVVACQCLAVPDVLRPVTLLIPHAVRV